jgi:ribosomal protein S18 acetylase RimI-like enzyme
MIIRLAEPSDKQGAGIIRATVLPPEHHYHYEDNIEDARCLNLVAEEADIVVGFVSVLLTVCNPGGQALWERLAPYIGFIGVLPDYQGKHVGPRLLQCAVRETATLYPNGSALYLEHAHENSRARGVFERCGFKSLLCEDVFKVTGLYPKGPVMALDLDTARAKSRIRDS